jgi:hypothetical protein
MALSDDCWYLVKIILVFLCHCLEIIESQFKPSDDLNLIQFIRSNKISQFSIKKSYGFWLWSYLADLLNLTKEFHPSNSLQSKQICFVEFKISNEMQEIPTNFLGKLFSINFLRNWFDGLLAHSLQFITVGVEFLDPVQSVVPPSPPRHEQINEAKERQRSSSSASTSASEADIEFHLDPFAVDRPSAFISWPPPSPGKMNPKMKKLPGATRLEQRIFKRFHFEVCSSVLFLSPHSSLASRETLPGHR